MMGEINKSKSYILPLLGGHISFKYVNFIVNTFLYPNKVEGGYNIILQYDKRVLLNDDGTEYIESIRHSDLFIDEPIIDDHIYLRLRIPTEYNEDVEYFLDGKYSKINNDVKNKIVIFLLKYYKNEFKVITRIKQVLTKDAALRRKLEKKFDVPFTRDMELSSKVNIEKETLIEEEENEDVLQ